MRRAISRRHGGQALLVFFVVLFGFGLGILQVAAHSRLVKSDPSARAVLDKAPKELKLWFNEGVEPAFAKVWIVPAQGAQDTLDQPWRQFRSAFLIVTLPDDLAAGPVVVGYHIFVGGIAHVLHAQLTFTIKKPA